MRKAQWLAILSILLCGAVFSPTAEARAKRKPRVRTMQATAFVGRGETTASGTAAREGIVAADPAVLPYGTRIHVSGSDGYDGVYLVTDTGGKVNGAHIDLCLRSRAEARQFGKKKVKVRVLKLGSGKESAREKDALARRSR